MINKDNIKNDLKVLSEGDVYSVSLGLLYRLTDIPEYATVSKLPYLLDRDSLFNLCEYYGGRTIRIPNLIELRRTLRTLLLYQAYEIEHHTWKDSLKYAGYKSAEAETADKHLRTFKEIISKYNLFTN